MSTDEGRPSSPQGVEAMAADRELRAAATDFFLRSCEHRYSYNFTWLGRPIIQYPQDIVALQEIVWRTKPEVIVETGIAHGGSAVLFASLLQLLGGDGRVVAVDIDIRAHNRAAIESHPLAARISLIEGSSVDERIAQRVRAATAGAHNVMVVLDSNHTHAHVRAELALYSPLVRKGGYLVVMDTVVEHMAADSFPDRPWGKGDNPMTAVREFLALNPRFEIDREIDDKLLVSVAPGGYLRCVAD
ncbi:MAG TPA: cephalosporin hydroxylase family protein [Candidatus Eremiobacteraceae bacterium]|nr:cephalosporin hydroxylase family protein [Candidatus Eremiobacteraceae bacterium]